MAETLTLCETVDYLLRYACRKGDGLRMKRLLGEKIRAFFTRSVLSAILMQNPYP